MLAVAADQDTDGTEGEIDDPIEDVDWVRQGLGKIYVLSSILMFYGRWGND